MLNTALEENKQPLISFEQVSYVVSTLRNQKFAVLSDLSFLVGKHEFVCIVGPSGCGKTSTLNIIAGFIQPTGGKVQILTGQDEIQPAMCFQSDTTFSWMSCQENLRFALRRNQHKGRTRNEDKGETKEDRQRKVEQIAELTGLSQFQHFYPKELSGGMRKRLELGRAWLTGSPILLLDEPLGQLDHMTRQAMQLTLQKLWWQDRRTVLMITHDIEEALFLSDRVLIMSGPPGQMVSEIVVPFARPRTDDCRYTTEIQALRRALQRQLEELEHAGT